MLLVFLRRIGRELIFEYRQDPEKLMNLLKKYDEHELKRKKARQRSQSVAVKPPVDVLIPPVVPAVVNVDEGEDEENLESQDEVPDLVSHIFFSTVNSKISSQVI